MAPPLPSRRVLLLLLLLLFCTRPAAALDDSPSGTPLPSPSFSPSGTGTGNGAVGPGVESRTLLGRFVRVGCNRRTGTLGSGLSDMPGIQYDASGSSAWVDERDFLAGASGGNPFGAWRVGRGELGVGPL